MTTHRTGPTQTTRRPLVSLFALLVGLAFLAVGALGFIPGITTNYDQMEFAGHESGAELFGIFQVSILHNIVHLAFGVIGLALAPAARAAMLYLTIGGLVYLALWIYGLVVDQNSDANFIPLNHADNWLHLGLGVGMIALGLIGWAAWRRRREYTPTHGA